MKQLFRKILAVLMTFVVIFSTLSFTISEHYCGDLLVDSAVFSKAKSCGMEIQNPSPIKDCELTKKNCCSDVVKLIKGQTNLKLDFNKLTIPQQQFVAIFTYTYLNLFKATFNKAIPFSDYSPPLVDKDISVLYQVFRI